MGALHVIVVLFLVIYYFSGQDYIHILVQSTSDKVNRVQNGCFSQTVGYLGMDDFDITKTAPSVCFFIKTPQKKISQDGSFCMSFQFPSKIPILGRGAKLSDTPQIKLLKYNKHQAYSKEIFLFLILLKTIWEGGGQCWDTL